jgi:hypothetical protein
MEEGKWREIGRQGEVVGDRGTERKGGREVRKGIDAGRKIEIGSGR